MVALISLLGFVVLSLGQTNNLNRITDGSIEGFLTIDEARSVFRDLVEKYPHLISEQPIGKSLEGRDIYAYRLTAIDGSHSNPPRLLLTSLMHAREPITLSASAFVISQLIDEYVEHVTDVEFLLKTRELYVIPVVNPDGYSRLTSTAGYRKNARKTCEDKPEEGGVDLNRNFAYDWKPVRNGCNEEYSGTGPFSEPETQAIRDFAIAKKFSSAVHFHAYGNILTIPYNGGDGKKSVRGEHMRFYQDIQAAWKFNIFGPSPKTLNYSTPGESDDWFYDELGVLSLSPELGPESDGFRPNKEEVRQVLLDIYPKIKLWMMRAGGAQIDSVKISSSDHSSEWYIEFENRGLVPLNRPTILVSDGGSCDTCNGADDCSVALEGKARVFKDIRFNEGSLEGWQNWTIPRCPRDTSLRTESIDICVVMQTLNCRCFRASPGEPALKFDIGRMSNYLANTALCEAAGITTYAGELSPYGTDASNLFGFFATLLLLIFVVFGLLRMIRDVLPPGIPEASLESTRLAKADYTNEPVVY